MISPRTFILALLILLIAPILSAPIHLHYGGTGSVHVYSSSTSGFKQDSPMLAVNGYRNPSLLTDSHIAGRSFIDGELKTSSIREPAKKARHENKKLVSRSFWSKIKNTVKSVGSSISKGVSKVASGVKNTAKKVGGAVSNVAKKVATAAKKTVNFVKSNGAKIAKVGFKAVAAATKIASHAVAFIPGIGKPVGQALSGISKVSDFVSAKIPAKLSRTLEKGMNILEKVEHPLGTGAAGQILDAVLKRDMEEESLVKRDLTEGEVLYERDIPELDVRSFDGDEIEARSFDDIYELEARSFDDGLELEARSWDFEDEE